MVKLTVADLEKTGKLLKKNEFISHFDIQHGWLVVRGKGRREQIEATDVITLILGFEPNAPNGWREPGQHRHLGLIVKQNLNFEILVRSH
jgi:hypothetical protein